MVFTVEVSCHIDLPLEQVFAYVADFRNAPSWQRQLVDVRLDDGPFPEGKRVVEIHHLLGLRVEAAGELVHWRAPEEFTVRGTSGPLRVESRYGIAVEPPGTRVTLCLTMAGRGPARLAEPALRRRLERELGLAFEKLAVSAGAVRASTD
jgi:uncharacterized membrane protein